MRVYDQVIYFGLKGKIALKVLILAMRGALQGTLTERHPSYHLPISNTGAGLQWLVTTDAVSKESMLI